MVATHDSIMSAINIVLTNQCLATYNCNSDCMFYDRNKFSRDYNEFKSCTAGDSTYRATKKVIFLEMLVNLYCITSRCSLTDDNFTYTKNGVCCKHSFSDMAFKYNNYNKKHI